MLSKLKISYKIFLTSLIQLVLISAVGFIGVTQMQKIGNEIVDIAEGDIPLTKSLTELTEHQLQEAILFEKALFKALLAKSGDESAKEEFLIYRKELNKLTKKIEKEIKAAEGFIDQAVLTVHSVKTKEEYLRVYESLKGVEKSYEFLSASVIKILDSALTDSVGVLAKQSKPIEKLQHQIDEELIDILNGIQSFTLAAALQAEHDEKIGLELILMVFAVSLLISLVIPFAISSSIVKPMKVLNARLEEISTGDGDLTMSLDESSRDEIGDVARSFNRFMAKLRGIITNVNESADVLGQSSEVAVEVMEETVTNVKQQHQETEVVANAVSEMSSTISSVAESTSNASVIAETVRKRVDEGKSAATETQSIVQMLSDDMDKASDVIESLAAETENIGGVLDAIRGIAEQTNLLALNAAIEAARAGDTGRGFAVVADEVRSLAQRTQASTGDIQQLVEGLQQEAGNAVETMKKGSDRTEMCLKKSSDTTHAFVDASQAVSEISDLNIQIATAAEEQSVVAKQINDSLNNIKNIAEMTTSGAQKTSMANKNIAEKLVELHTNLNQFQI